MCDAIYTWDSYGKQYFLELIKKKFILENMDKTTQTL